MRAWVSAVAPGKRLHAVLRGTRPSAVDAEAMKAREGSAAASQSSQEREQSDLFPQNSKGDGRARGVRNCYCRSRSSASYGSCGGISVALRERRGAVDAEEGSEAALAESGRNTEGDGVRV